jgi:hypothetical protein
LSPIRGEIKKEFLTLPPSFGDKNRSSPTLYFLENPKNFEPKISPKIGDFELLKTTSKNVFSPK